MSAETGNGRVIEAPGRFSEAIASIRAVVGAEHVLERWEEIEPHTRDTLPAVRVPCGIVSPGSTEEVQAVVTIAAEHRLPVWPSSRGRNWAYGAVTPSLDGSLVLLLDRMNRIREVNRELAYAVIEPGVTFQQLQDYLAEHDIPLWVDVTESTPQGSILGNALDRGIGVTPYGDHFGNLCGLEAVLADGSLLNTGAGGADSRVQHVYKWGTGPYVGGLFGQSGFGVVTGAGIWLMPKPESFCLYTLELEREADLPRLIDATRQLVLTEKIRTHTYFVNDVARITAQTRCPMPAGAARTHLLPAEVDALRERHGIPRWALNGGLYGTPRQIRMQQREMRQVLGQFGKLRFIDERRLESVRGILRLAERSRKLPVLSGLVRGLIRRLIGKSAETLAALPHAYARASGQTTEYLLRVSYYKARQPWPTNGRDVDPARDGGGLIWCAPSMPNTGEHVMTVLGLCRPLFAEHGFDFVAALMTHNPRAVTLVMGILYYKDSPEETARAEALYRRLREVTGAAGYPTYRVSAPHQHEALDGRPDFREVADRLKAAIDPEGIIAPGRYGVGQRTEPAAAEA